ASLLQGAVRNSFIQLPGRPGQQIGSEFAQRLEFFVAHVRALVLAESEQKEPAAALVGRDENPGSAALTPSRQLDALLDQPAAEVCVDQTSGHFFQRTAKQVFRQARLPNPSTKGAGLEDST